MPNILLLLLFNFLKFLDKFLLLLTNKSFLISLKDKIEKNSNKEVEILNKKIIFFIPNKLIKWRVETLRTKEPETLEWIDTFNKNEKIIFWDIGANIGLYSIYNALRNNNSLTISFEPSTSNLRTLSRNIYLNNLQNKIKIFSLPLGNKENVFLNMKEKNFYEGGALNSFGVNYNFEGKSFKDEMNYDLFGTTINFCLKQSFLDIPDYIKIDVDGIEHLILDGANEFLKNKKIKSISVEINENFKEQFEKTLKIMEECDFSIKHKKRNDSLFQENSKFSNLYNYIFEKKQ